MGTNSYQGRIDSYGGEGMQLSIGIIETTTVMVAHFLNNHKWKFGFYLCYNSACPYVRKERMRSKTSSWITIKGQQKKKRAGAQ